ncbi:enoyl-CoA hydratase-related protein [Nocardioides aurantiacus]|uniref:Enoyl-CoA hydratase n=1 Tax=Nocardioides aurantiacus TaxID=86796 RepID=A0A3N2CYC4_9ACTN|nr:enoyl-CoA hydratase-related protein [Nocardioides aurantiacus]ROR92428.1 enoyl-CoA hydratase [Nocardioides aurantiacus]
MSEPVRYALDRGVATITLDRPEAMNGLDLPTKEALLAAVRRAADDVEVRCVVLTGSGRAFCVGQDLKEHQRTLADPSTPPLDTVEQHYNPIVSTLVSMPKPVVAAVNGVAAGAGVSLALACDFRVMAEPAGFNLAFAGIALSCDTGSSWTLPRLVGRAKALELLYFPRTIASAEALSLGLVTTVVPADDLAGEVATLARRLADGPTVAYGAIRRSVEHAAGHSFDEALAFEAEMMALTGQTSDHRAAVSAFVEKRKPEFGGR